MTYFSTPPPENNVYDPEHAQILSKTHEKAFVEIYDEYWNSLYHAAYSRLKDKDIAEEITQEVFADLWERQELSNIRNIRNYLLTAIKFAVIDHIRHQSAKKRFLEYHKTFVESDRETHSVIDYQNLPNLLQEGMGGLSETTRRIFELNHLQNWKKEKIADYFQLSEKAIEYHLTKSLKSVKLYLKSIVF
jgi:RNA polymerase sigma factor (sigma-70 family)